MRSCFYVGKTRHRRFSPKEHAFAYRDRLFLLDLDELQSLFRGRWFWSTSRFNLGYFRRKDHFGDPQRSLKSVVNARVREAGHRRRGERVAMLAHLRVWGGNMNPLTLYFCFGPSGHGLEAVVAEVHNTPWGERHTYVLPVDPARSTETLQVEHDKEFHVSPFMPMDMTYRWRITQPGESLVVHLENHRAGERVFDATMTLERRPITRSELTRALTLDGPASYRVRLGIYAHAFRLWRKGLKFFSHPGGVRSPAPPSGDSKWGASAGHDSDALSTVAGELPPVESVARAKGER